MEVTRTFDEEFVQRCYAVPETWNAIADDNGMHPDLFFPNMDVANYWLEVKDGTEKLGVFLGRQTNACSYEAHTILLPSARGRAREAAKSAIAWMFANTGCLRLTTSIPDYNEAALKLALAVGFKQYGRNEKSFLKAGTLHDELLLGISKGKP